MEFNEKLQELRKRENLTQEELAEILHVSRAAVIIGGILLSAGLVLAYRATAFKK